MLTEFEAVVDVRVRVLDGKIKIRSPWQSFISKEIQEHHTWLQLSRGEVEDMMAILSNVIKELDIAGNADGNGLIMSWLAEHIHVDDSHRKFLYVCVLGFLFGYA